MGFNRTNDMLNEMERVGIVSGTVRGKQREVLVTLEELEEILEKDKGVFVVINKNNYLIRHYQKTIH